LWSDFLGFPDAQAVRASYAHAHVHACQGGYAGSAGGGAKMCDNCNQAGHIAAQVCDTSNAIIIYVYRYTSLISICLSLISICLSNYYKYRYRCRYRCRCINITLSFLLQCPGAPQCHCCGSTAHAKRDCPKVLLTLYLMRSTIFSIFRFFEAHRAKVADIYLYLYAAGRSV
jgi:hypothetical protein